MASDILQSVRDEILEEDKKSLPWVPKHLDKTWEHQAGIAGAIAGMIAGFTLGSHMGVAGPWGAIAGTVPCTIIGGVIGYFGAAKIGSGVQRDKQALLFNSDQSKQIGAGVNEPNKTLGSLSSAQTVDRPVSKPNDAYLNPSGDCHKCGRKKSSWWDSSKNRCSWCGSPPLAELPNRTFGKLSECRYCKRLYNPAIAGQTCHGCGKPFSLTPNGLRSERSISDDDRISQTEKTQLEICHHCGQKNRVISSRIDKYNCGRCHKPLRTQSDAQSTLHENVNPQKVPIYHYCSGCGKFNSLNPGRLCQACVVAPSTS